MSEGADQKPSLTSLQAVNAITKPYRARIAFFSLCTFGVGLLEAFFLVVVTRTGLAIANGQAVVGVTRGVNLTVSDTALVGVLVLAVRFALYYATARVQTGLQYRITAGYRRQLGFSFLGTSWMAQSQQPPGFLQQVLVQFPSHIAGVVGLLASAISAGLGLVALLGIALVINVASTLLVLAALVVLALILLPIARSVRRKSTTSVEHQATFANNVAEVSILGLEINAFGVRSRVRDKLAELIDNEVAATRRVTLTSSLVSPIYMTLAYGAVLLALLALDSVGAEDINQVGAVMLIMMRSLSYGQQFQNSLTGVAASAPYAQTILQTATSFASETRDENSIAISSIDSLAFEKVGFSYPNRPPTLTDATFSIVRGETIGVVGPSGAGKTTLIQLLLDLLPPSYGNITVNGRQLESIDRRDWSRLACYVPQEPKLITGTIADNVRFFRPKVSNSDVAWALARANLPLDPDRFPDGIHTDLGVAGRQLSGGQRQRIVIARALASHPSLLILDEPTSALDAESEEIISETLRNLKGEVTVVVVSHRATTLQICDRVLIVEQGLVREQSTRP